MIPVLFHIGPLTVYSYGLMMALGFLAADWVVTAECHRRSITPDYASSLIVWAAIVGIASSRILDIFNNFSSYMADPKSMIFSGSGFVWYGGMIGGIIAVYVVSRRYGIPFPETADMTAPALAIGQAIGRIGCLLSGDGDWGLPSRLPWAMAFPKAIVGWNSQTVLKLDPGGNLVSGFFPGVRVHPTPIYEAILYTGVFLILWSLRRKGLAAGRILYLYLILAGAARFMVEFLRVNPRVFEGLSEAQLIAIGMMIVGAVAWVASGEKRAPAAAKEAARA
ncbi:MAG TPA: prolipoprotein diacylglyceryl transferase [Candidatus Binataceae bacterium]|nr:prolipoprotein diacylglyceryl transferase [Candidatus Binataceae bacterium]